MEIEIVNARIKGTFLGYEDHGIFTSDITLDYGSSFQSFGGWSIKGEHTSRWIESILTVLELNSWEELENSLIRVKREKSYNGKIIAIGHVLKDSWFEPTKDLGFK
jgi:hypothetical protein